MLKHLGLLNGHIGTQLCIKYILEVYMVFKIIRKDREGNDKTVLADDIERAFELYQLAGRFDKHPRVLFNDKEITYNKLHEMVKLFREKQKRFGKNNPIGQMGF